MKSRFHILVQQTQKVKKLQDGQPRLYHRFIEGKRLGCAAFFQAHSSVTALLSWMGTQGTTLQPFLGGLTSGPEDCPSHSRSGGKPVSKTLF